MGFLPEDYTPPVSGKYAKLQQGDNRLRILSEAIVGHLYWEIDTEGGRHPIRRAYDQTIRQGDLPIDPQTGEPAKIKHFWAFAIWNYQARQVQILEITQKTVQGGIESLSRSDDWGDPRKYDITIKREGSGLDTEYAVMPKPPTPLDAEAKEAWEAVSIDLTALFRGEDPFGDDAAGGAGGSAETSATRVTGAIDKAAKKTTESGTTFWIVTVGDTTAGTFDQPTGEDLVRGKEQGASVEMSIVPTTRGGWQIDSFRFVDNAPAGEATLPPVPDDDDIPF